MVSPNSSRPQRLIRKKSEHESVQSSNFGSFSLAKKALSPTYKYIQGIKKRFSHIAGCVKCEECNECDCFPDPSAQPNTSCFSMDPPNEKCNLCGRKISADKQKQNLKSNNKSLGRSQINDGGELTLDDLVSNNNSEIRDCADLKSKSKY